MSDDAAARSGPHRPRRAAKLGDSRAPVTTIAMLTVAAIAVITGFLILRSITDQTAGSNGAVSDAATALTATPVPTTDPATPVSTMGLSPSTTTTTTTTAAPRASRADATVVVVNASGVDGSATAMAAALAADGYTTAPVANSTGPRLEQSIIYYLEGDGASLGVARLLADQIPTAQTLPMPEPPPLDRPLDRATVALMLGSDAAGRPLAEPQTG